MIIVTVFQPGREPETLRFNKESVMIGRAAGNDVHLEAEGISRYHARLSLDGTTVSIQDLNSTNGSFLNGDRVQHQAVEPKDKISIGSAVLNAVYDPTEIEFTGQATVESVSGTYTGGTASLDQTGSPAQPGESDSAKVARSTEKSQADTKSQKRPTEEFPKEKEKEKEKEKSDDGVEVKDAFFWQSLAGFLGPIWEYIMDDAVSEIMINGPEEIYIEKKGQLQPITVQFNDDQLRAAVLNIAQYVGRRVSEEEPYMDARLPDGSRVAILMPPCSRKGISISIRKFAKEALTVDKLINFGSFSKEMETFLKACVVLKKNMIISGGTSSGKTSLLNVISGLIPNDERILTIEDAAELQLSQDHVLPMETKAPDKKGRGQVTIRDLVKASLRMRPDRIVVGEIRGGEALDLLQAMNTGHSGSMATVHASSPSQALTRLETLALFSGIEIPMRALREQVSTALEVIIQASRLPDHSRKVTHISLVAPLKEDGTYLVHHVFRFKNTGRLPSGKIEGRHVWTGHIPSFFDEMKLSGLHDAVELLSGGLEADSTVAEDKGAH
jgi:pilus assembly protein CpaF